MAFGPIDYASLIQAPNFAQSLSQGLQAGDQLHQVIKRRPQEEAMQDAQKQLALQQIALKVQQAKAYQTDVADAISNPSPDKYRSLMLKFPEQHDAIKAGWDGYTKDQQDSVISTSSGVWGALNAGSVDTAKNLLTQRRDALKSAGIDTTETQTILDLVEKGDPQSLTTARGLAGLALSHAYGPDKGPEMLKTLGTERRADEEQPYKVSVARTDAEFKPILNRATLDNISSTIAARTAGTDIARDTLTSNVQLKLTEMAKTATTLTPQAQSSVEKYVVSAETSRAMAGRIGDIADQFGSYTAAHPTLAGQSLSEMIKSATGSQDGLTKLKAQYSQLIATQISSNLPPGSASDSDVALARKGFPSENASPEYISSFLRGMQKLQEFSANRDASKADWLSGNGNLGTAKTDLTVNGVKVPAGTSYTDFSKTRAAFERADPVQSRGYMRYGQ